MLNRVFFALITVYALLSGALQVTSFATESKGAFQLAPMDSSNQEHQIWDVGPGRTASSIAELKHVSSFDIDNAIGPTWISTHEGNDVKITVKNAFPDAIARIHVKTEPFSEVVRINIEYPSQIKEHEQSPRWLLRCLKLDQCFKRTEMIERQDHPIELTISLPSHGLRNLNVSSLAGDVRVKDVASPSLKERLVVVDTGGSITLKNIEAEKGIWALTGSKKIYFQDLRAGSKEVNCIHLIVPFAIDAGGKNIVGDLTKNESPIVEGTHSNDPRILRQLRNEKPRISYGTPTRVVE